MNSLYYRKCKTLYATIRNHYMKVTFFIIFTLVITFAKGQIISGKVLDLATNKPLPESIAYLLETSSVIDTLIPDADNYYFEGAWGHKIISKVKVDSNGLFTFQVIRSKSYTVCVSYKMPYFYFGEKKTDSGYSYREKFVHKLSIKGQDRFYKIFYLMVTCPYDKTRNQSFCPKCKMTDKVVPIYYGLPILDENGGIEGKSFEEYHLGGCGIDSYCNATKHCNRCSKDF